LDASTPGEEIETIDLDNQILCRPRQRQQHGRDDCGGEIRQLNHLTSSKTFVLSTATIAADGY